MWKHKQMTSTYFSGTSSQTNVCASNSNTRFQDQWPKNLKRPAAIFPIITRTTVPVTKACCTLKRSVGQWVLRQPSSSHSCSNFTAISAGMRRIKRGRNSKVGFKIRSRLPGLRFRCHLRSSESEHLINFWIMILKYSWITMKEVYCNTYNYKCLQVRHIQQTSTLKCCYPVVHSWLGAAVPSPAAASAAVPHGSTTWQASGCRRNQTIIEVTSL